MIYNIINDNDNFIEYNFVILNNINKKARYKKVKNPIISKVISFYIKFFENSI